MSMLSTGPMLTWRLARLLMRRSKLPMLGLGEPMKLSVTSAASRASRAATIALQARWETAGQRGRSAGPMRAIGRARPARIWRQHWRCRRHTHMPQLLSVSEHICSTGMSLKGSSIWLAIWRSSRVDGMGAKPQEGAGPVHAHAGCRLLPQAWCLPSLAHPVLAYHTSSAPSSSIDSRKTAHNMPQGKPCHLEVSGETRERKSRKSVSLEARTSAWLQLAGKCSGWQPAASAGQAFSHS